MYDDRLSTVDDDAAESMSTIDDDAAELMLVEGRQATRLDCFSLW